MTISGYLNSYAYYYAKELEIPFKPLDPKFTITVLPDSTTNGWVSGGKAYYETTTAKVKAVPRAGYRFVQWLEGSKQVSTKSIYSFAVAKARTLKADFTKISIPTLTAKSAGSTKIKLTWTKATGAKGYRIFRATSKDGPYKRIKVLTGTSYTDTGLKTGKTYYYKVRAYCVTDTRTTYGGYSHCKYAKPVR